MPHIKKEILENLKSTIKYYKEKVKEFSPKMTVDDWLKYESKKGYMYRTLPCNKKVDWVEFIEDVAL
jgi:hypothetical protein